MNKDYTLISSNRQPQPRSKRLRSLGASAPVGSTVSGATSSGDGAVIEGHTHDNKAALDRIDTDNDGYGYVTRNVETTEEVTDETTGKTTVVTSVESVKEKI